MSADLFAEFGSSTQDVPQRGGQQQGAGLHTAAPAPAPAPPHASLGDPFAFLASSSSSSAAPTPAFAQPLQQGWPQQWPQFQRLQPGSDRTSNGSPWGDANTMSDLGGGGGSNRNDIGAKDTEDDDDNWGDFEVASPGAGPSSPKPTPSVSASSVSTQPSVAYRSPPRTRIVRASTLDMITNSLVDVGGSAGPTSSRLETHVERPSQEASTPPVKPVTPKPKNADPNVLFDADDYDAEVPGSWNGEGDDEDEFGDFETVAPAVPSSKTGPPAPAAVDLMSSDLDLGSLAGAAVRREPPSMLLSSLSLGVDPSRAPYPQAPKSPSFQERNPFPGLAVTTPIMDEFPADAKRRSKSPSPVTVWPTVEGAQTRADDPPYRDDWAAFGDTASEGQASKPQAQLTSPGWDWDLADGVASGPGPSNSIPGKAERSLVKPPTHTRQRSSWDWASVSPDKTGPGGAVAPTSRQSRVATTKQPSPPETNDSAPPPTNVPPPSILLSVFPPLLELPNDALFKPTTTAAAAASVRNRVLADPVTANFLRGYLALATVAARVLAGRRLRWQRDRFLSQGMSISAAPAVGKGGGMKLAGVDKAEAAREDREAADVVATWRGLVGRLRAAVSAVNLAQPKQQQPLPKIPELADKPGVQTIKQVPTAPKPCVICGLRRDERVKGVDFDVEDSFGEWWVEHWGHRVCRNFWVEHEARLRQR